jgi:hypothetical protein
VNAYPRWCSLSVPSSLCKHGQRSPRAPARPPSGETMVRQVEVERADETTAGGFDEEAALDAYRAAVAYACG